MSCGTHLKFEVNFKNMSTQYLKVAFLENVPQGWKTSECRVTPFATPDNKIFYASIKKSEKLTQGEGVKTVYTIAFDFNVEKPEFRPGDTIGILPSNCKNLISKILSRLKVNSVADKPCELQVLPESLKKNPTVPKHLPVRNTIRNIFLNHVDVQTPPKKLFLKSLVRFTQDPQEQLQLEQLCSPKSSKEYTEFITTNGRTLLGLLDAFPSCQPPVEILLEYLPPLLPRPYSISSAPSSCNIEITFFVLVHDDGRRGLCTGWLEDLVLDNSKDLVPFYFRKPTLFRLPQEISVPFILIATGTGIAPFRGFLQDLNLNGSKERPVWLFYGCRYREKDFLFKHEIEQYEKVSVLKKLNVSFSREETKAYVQHKIKKNGEEFTEWVARGARIFVCGDYKTVVRDVRTTIGDLVTHPVLEEMEKNGRFLVDAWV